MPPIPLPVSASPYFTAASVGFLVAPEFTINQRAAVLGVITHGVYIQLENRRVAFLSFEPFHGGLTVNLDHRPPETWNLQPGEEVQIQPGWVRIPQIGVEIDLQDSPLWQPLPVRANDGGLEQIRTRLGQIAAHILTEEKSSNGFAPLLPTLLGLEPRSALTEEHRRVLPLLLELRRRIRHSQMDSLASLIESLTGIGRGLTPASDDVLIGLLLLLNRSAAPLLAPQALAELNRVVIETTTRRTTSLAASMAWGAAQGTADERLVSAADCALTGWYPPPTAAQHLLWYGSSSGMDALVGMALV